MMKLGDLVWDDGIKVVVADEVRQRLEGSVGATIGDGRQGGATPGCLDDVARALNELARIEPEAMGQIFGHQVSVGEEFANHPGIVASRHDVVGAPGKTKDNYTVYLVGVLGLLNGLLAGGDRRLVAVLGENTGQPLRFEVM